MKLTENDPVNKGSLTTSDGRLFNPELFQPMPGEGVMLRTNAEAGRDKMRRAKLARISAHNDLFRDRRR